MIYPVKYGYSSAVPLSAPAYVPEINGQPVEGIEEASRRRAGKKGVADVSDSFEDVSKLDEKSMFAIKIRKDDKVIYENYQESASSVDGVEASRKTAEMQAAISAQMMSMIRA